MTRKERVLEWIDDYFSLGNRVAAVVPFKKAREGSTPTEIRERPRYMSSESIKVVSYFTIVVPLIVLVAKIVFRHYHKFHIKPSIIEDTVQKLQPQESHFTVEDITAIGNRVLGLRYEREAFLLEVPTFLMSLPLNASTQDRCINTDTKIASWCKWKQQRLLSSYEKEVDRIIMGSTKLVLPTPGAILDVARKTRFSVLEYESAESTHSPSKVFPLPQVDVDKWDLSEKFKNYAFYEAEDANKVSNLLVSHYRKSFLDYIRTTNQIAKNNSGS